ncbi:MAG: TonB-dependent receptor [Steroidobacteraceae bacterium]|jgi:iron complex outermembrane recepter protein
MTRSKLRKLKRAGAILASMPLPATLLTAMPAAYAQETSEAGTLEEVIVTAQKHVEDLQNVPVSITVLGTEELEQQHVESFNDYMKLLPSTSVQVLGPGNDRVFMRGIATGDYPNHSASLPSVGTYLDEQPITTILGAIDLHMYDIQRVEALAGPQGTLYGASSEAGTIRIITNKPDASHFSAAYDVEVNDVAHGTFGGIAEGYVNVPVSSNAAVRLVGWYERDSGYIDNVANTLTYPATSSSPAIAINNAGLAKNHYNDVETWGGRAALKVDLNDQWSITPVLISQITESNGIFAEELVESADTALSAPVGPYQVSHFLPEPSMDDFVDAALTVEGRISNIDVTYAASYMKRHNTSASDYTDYSLAYDALYGSGVIWHDTSGKPINPSQYIIGGYNYQSYSNELRFSTPAKDPLRFVGGLYQQRQQNFIFQRYEVNGSNGDGLDAGNGTVPSESVTGWPNTWWLTDQLRVNRDWAVFGELSYDILPKLTGTAGLRWFDYDNTLGGFYGFGLNNPLGTPGQQSCSVQTPLYGAPCQDLVQPASSGKGTTPKFNLTYHIDDDRLLYATFSRGFRPGGVNRIANAGVSAPYKPDFLTNYEIGWKTAWFGRTLRFNGALYVDDWKNFQYDFLGPNSVTIIANAAQARSKGAEAELQWAATHNLTLTANAAYTDARLTANYCGTVDAGGNPITNCASPLAPSGTQLPVTPPFKGNMTARYTFPLGGYEAFAEGTLVDQDAVWPDLRLVQRSLIGSQPGFTTFDLSTGIQEKTYSLEIYAKNLFNETVQLYRYAECTPQTCAPYTVYAGLGQPRLIGIKYGQKF